MALTTTENKKTYVGDGIITVLNFPYQFHKSSDLNVYISGNNGLDDPVLKSEGSDYTVSGAGSVNGGSVTLTTALLATEKAIVIRNVPLTQESDYKDFEALKSNTLENNFDKLTMHVQQLQEQLNRVILQSLLQDGSITFPTLDDAKYLSNDGSKLLWTALTNTNYQGNITYGTFAERPETPSQIGDIYIATDTAVIYFATSSTTWTAIGSEVEPTPYTVNLTAITTSTNQLLFQLDKPHVVTCITATKSGGTSFAYHVKHHWNRNATTAEKVTAAAITVDVEGAGIVTTDFAGGVPNIPAYHYVWVEITAQTGNPDATITVNVKPDAAATAYTLLQTLFNPTGNPIGGGPGYSNVLTIASADYTPANVSELKTALATAVSGETIWLDKDTIYDLTGEQLVIPKGVNLVSDRGVSESRGGLIKSDTTYPEQPGPIEPKAIYGTGDIQNSSGDVNLFVLAGVGIQGRNISSFASSDAGARTLITTVGVHSVEDGLEVLIWGATHEPYNAKHKIIYVSTTTFKINVPYVAETVTTEAFGRVVQLYSATGDYTGEYALERNGDNSNSFLRNVTTGAKVPFVSTQSVDIASFTDETFICFGNNRITGVRFKGPYAIAGDNDYVAFGISTMLRTFGTDIEIDNCDFHACNKRAIDLAIVERTHIHHNHIHITRRAGYGYGIWCGGHDQLQDNDVPLIQANILEHCRHEIGASAGTSEMGSYNARNNLILEHYQIDHMFDAHTQGGYKIDIIQNIFGSYSGDVIAGFSTTPPNFAKAGARLVIKNIFTDGSEETDIFNEAADRNTYNITLADILYGASNWRQFQPTVTVSATIPRSTSPLASTVITATATDPSSATINAYLWKYKRGMNDEEVIITSTNQLTLSGLTTGIYIVSCYARNSIGLYSRPASITITVEATTDADSLAYNLISFFDGNNTDLLNDKHSFGFDLEANTGTVAYAAGVNGDANGAYDFDGATNLVVPFFGKTDAFQIYQSDISFSLWIYIDALPGSGNQQGLFSCGAGSGDAPGHRIVIRESSSAADIWVYLSDGLIRQTLQFSSVDMAISTWYCICGNIDLDGNVTIWVNGEKHELAISGLNLEMHGDERLEICQTGGDANRFNGRMEKLMFWRDKLLTEREVVRLINLGKGLEFADLALSSYSPVDIPELQFWLDASDPTSIKATGGLVDKIIDRSGKGNHATSTGTDRPGTGANTLNSLNVLDFDGTEFLTIPYAPGLNPSDFSIITVVRPTSVAAEQGIFTSINASSASGGFNVQLGTTNKIGGLLNDGTDDSTEYLSSASNPVNNTPYLTVITNDDTGGALRVDETDEDTSTKDVNFDANSNLAVGRFYVTSSSLMFIGDIAEILLFNKVLSSSEILAEEARLKAKWWP